MENIFYNYALLDPTKPGVYPIRGTHIIFKYEPFYIGKGNGKRIIATVKEKTDYFKNNKIKSLKKDGYEPISTIFICNLQESVSFDNEKYCIKILGRRNLNLGPLTNLTDGGEGGKGYIKTEEERESIRKRQTGSGNSFYGKKCSEEHKKIISEANKNKIISKETRRKMSAWQVGKKHSLETIEKIRKKNSIEILQFTLDDVFIKEWSSSIEAKKVLNIDNSSILKACKGKIETAGNFKWKYK